MAGMKRFVTYIYAYEDKRKGNNAGFARIEIRGEDCRIGVHLRGIYPARMDCQVYLFREDAGDITGFWIGDLKVMNGGGDFGTVVKAEKIGDSPFGIYEMEGIFLLGDDDRIFMSCWKEGLTFEVCRERFKRWRGAGQLSRKEEGREARMRQSDRTEPPARTEQFNRRNSVNQPNRWNRGQGQEGGNEPIQWSRPQNQERETEPDQWSRLQNQGAVTEPSQRNEPQNRNTATEPSRPDRADSDTKRNQPNQSNQFRNMNRLGQRSQPIQSQNPSMVTEPPHPQNQNAVTEPPQPQARNTEPEPEQWSRPQNQDIVIVPEPDQRTEPQTRNAATEPPQPNEPQNQTAVTKPDQPGGRNTGYRPILRAGNGFESGSEPPQDAGEKNGPKAEEETENISATEIPMRNIFPRFNWLEVWEKLKKDRGIFAPFDAEEIVCVRIELKDLRELPKRYWYLGNNSFLLHGFFNYHYLVIGKIENDRWFIGIPGIYQNQERVMAAIFGFPEFIPVREEKREAAPAENPKETGEPLNRFGYWYRFMEE